MRHSEVSVVAPRAQCSLSACRRAYGWEDSSSGGVSAWRNLEMKPGCGSSRTVPLSRRMHALSSMIDRFTLTRTKRLSLALSGRVRLVVSLLVLASKNTNWIKFARCHSSSGVRDSHVPMSVPGCSSNSQRPPASLQTAGCPRSLLQYERYTGLRIGR